MIKRNPWISGKTWIMSFYGTEAVTKLNRKELGVGMRKMGVNMRKKLGVGMRKVGVGTRKEVKRKGDLQEADGARRIRSTRPDACA